MINTLMMLAMIITKHKKKYITTINIRNNPFKGLFFIINFYIFTFENHIKKNKSK